MIIHKFLYFYIMKKLIILLLCGLMAACESSLGTKALLLENSLSKDPPFVDEVYDLNIEATNTWNIEGGELINDISHKTLEITNDARLSKDNIRLVNGNNYTLNFKLRSDIPLDIDLEVGDGEHILLAENIISDGSVKDLSFSFMMDGSDTWEAYIRFSFNNADNLATVWLDDFLLMPDNAEIGGIKTNHIGYFIGHNKTVTFSYNQGNYFNVYKDDGTLAGSYVIGNGQNDDDSGEYNFIGDFSDIDEAGTYYIISETGSRSHDFMIGEDLYDDLLNDALRFIYLQRCGMAIDESISQAFAHDVCHDDEALIYGHGEYRDVSGGWHDAGDYGRYVQTSTKVLADLLTAYYFNRDTLVDLNDALLEEIRYGLDWLLKLKSNDGLIYNKVTTQNFADIVAPDEDENELYILQPWTLTTASYAGVMALGAMVFEDHDLEYAQELKKAAMDAGEVLKAYNDPIIKENPAEFNTGEYRDNNENDERFFAYVALYLLSDDADYYHRAQEIYQKGEFSQGFQIANMKNYGMYLLIEEDDEFAKDIKEDLLANADASYHTSLSTNYHYPFTGYAWGSNAYVADDISLMMIAYRISGLSRYQESAISEMNYILGLNPLDMCFVTCYGYNYPQDIHHRITMANGLAEKGLMVGGVDEIMSDGNLSSFISEDTPRAKRYVDDHESYSTNEVATYYNSSLFLALSFFKDLS